MGRILIVDDNELFAPPLAAALSAAGHAADVAPTLARARILMQVRSYSAVILDGELPDGRGVTLCRDAWLWRANCPVLLMTGGGAAVIAQARREPRITAAWEKPVAPAAVLAFLREHALGGAGAFAPLIGQEERQTLLRTFLSTGEGQA